MQPIRIALVNLNKPYDLAVVAQTALAIPRVEVILVGKTLDLSHPKVVGKVRSWTINPSLLDKIPTRRIARLDEIKDANLIGMMPSGGTALFELEPSADDIFVLGGANGLSQHDISLLQNQVTLACDPRVPFLTVASVVPTICYYTDFILSQGGQ